jgi:hypothetical protein
MRAGALRFFSPLASTVVSFEVASRCSLFCNGLVLRATAEPWGPGAASGPGAAAGRWSGCEGGDHPPGAPRRRRSAWRTPDGERLFVSGLAQGLRAP